MATINTYALFKDIEWGETIWVLCAPNCSPFGRYTTAAAAKADAKIYRLTVQRREDMDAKPHFKRASY